MLNVNDNCKLVVNADQQDLDGEVFSTALVPNEPTPFTSHSFHLPMHFDVEIPTGNHLGDACDLDFDGDGVVDKLDNCPRNKEMWTTDFNRFRKVNLNPSDGEPDAAWLLLNDGMELRQAADTNTTAMFIGELVFCFVFKNVHCNSGRNFLCPKVWQGGTHTASTIRLHSN